MTSALLELGKRSHHPLSCLLELDIGESRDLRLLLLLLAKVVVELLLRALIDPLNTHGCTPFYIVFTKYTLNESCIVFDNL